MIPGETIRSGGSPQCEDCGMELMNQVLESAAGFYIGTQCMCGPYSRESYYYETHESAAEALANESVLWR